MRSRTSGRAVALLLAAAAAAALWAEDFTGKVVAIGAAVGVAERTVAAL